MLIIIYGEDTFLSRRELNNIKNFYLAKNPFYFSYDFEDKKGEDLEIIKNVFSERSLFANTKVIVLENIFSRAPKEYQKKILTIFQKNNVYEAKDILVILYDVSSQIDISLFKNKAKLIKNFPVLEGVKLLNFIKKESSLFNISLDSQALQLLVMNFGNDSGMIYFALKKLSQLEKKIITKNDVLATLSLETNSNVFDLLEAIINKKTTLALKLLNAELQSQMPMLIFWHLIKEVRILIILNQTTINNVKTITKKFNINYYVAKKLYTLSKKYTMKELLSIYQQLAAYDMKIKTGKLDASLALNFSILDFNNLMR